MVSGELVTGNRQMGLHQIHPAIHGLLLQARASVHS